MQDLPGAARRVLAALQEYLDPRRRRRLAPVRDGAELAQFLQTRSSYVAQMSLYGYLRTRAGMRYPELFDDDAFVGSINIAKWHVWLACLADLTVYAGGLLVLRGAAPEAAGRVARAAAEAVLAGTGVPEDAGGEFPEHARRVRARLADCDWARVTDGEGPFTESPPALVRWAPVVDELKELDAEIVQNSVRFRWQEVRRDLRRALDAEAVLASAGERPGERARAPDC